MKKIKYYVLGLLTFTLGTFMSSCEESYPHSVESPYDTELISVKIVNGGADKSTVHEGIIDQVKKEISFKRFDLETDFSALKVVAEVSNGASIEKEVYDYSMGEDASMTQILRVVNNTRYKDFRMTVRKKVPVWGAEFSEENVKVYDFSGKGNSQYPDLAAALTRSADMDGEHIFIVSRATQPHLLAIKDIKEGVINSIPLKGAPTLWSGRMAHGHIYGIGMPTPINGGIVQIYHWDKNALGKDASALIPGGYDRYNIPGWNDNPGRLGDYMSVNIDDKGNGFIFLGTNTNKAESVLRLTVTNFTSISNPTMINPTPAAGSWASYNVVDGNPSEYIYTGHQGEIMLVDDKGEVSYSIPSSVIPHLNLVDASVINFNQKRYLIGTSVDKEVTLKIYDMTRGQSTKDGLTNLSESNPLVTAYKYELGGSIVTTARAGIIGWHKEGEDELLRILVAGTGSGFAVCEFTKALQPED